MATRRFKVYYYLFKVLNSSIKIVICAIVQLLYSNSKIFLLHYEFIMPVSVIPVKSGSWVLLAVSPLADFKKWELSSNYESVKLKKKKVEKLVLFLK